MGGGQDREVDSVSAGSAALPDGPRRSGVGSLLSAGPAEEGVLRAEHHRRRSMGRHLEGDITIAVYAINPSTQRSKWLAIDADYRHALEDLLKLQCEIRHDGIQAALEKSKRGAHLWVFFESPVLAQEARLYVLNLADRLTLPVKGVGWPEGIEV